MATVKSQAHKPAVQQNAKVLLDRCPEDSKLLITGYTREIANLLRDDHDADDIILLRQIPTQIVHFIIAYYHLENDRFVECGNQYIVVSDEGLTIENMKDHWDTAYGEFEIDCDDLRNKNMIFRWTLEVHNYASNCISIGIDETKRQWVNDYPDRKTETVSYRLNADSVPYGIGKRMAVSDMERNGGPQTGDTVEMELDLKQKTLTYHRTKSKGEPLEEKERMCQLTDIQTENVIYCLSIYLWHRGKISLMELSIERPE